MNSTPEHENAPLDAPLDQAGAETPAAPHVDPTLIEAHELALSALREITPSSSIGETAGYRIEGENVVSLRFHNLLEGYPGWFWTVTIAKVEDFEPTVLEVELLPGDGALIAPEWTPWAVRLAEYHAAQEALAEAREGEPGDDADDESDDDDDDLDDIEDLDASDFDNDGSPILHAGDLDGVDIDELDPSVEDDDESDDDDDDSDDESDDDDDESDDDDDDADESDDDDDESDDDER
jgi:hypothetical protein